MAVVEKRRWIWHKSSYTDIDLDLFIQHWRYQRKLGAGIAIESLGQVFTLYGDPDLRFSSSNGCRWGVSIDPHAWNTF